MQQLVDVIPRTSKQTISFECMRDLRRTNPCVHGVSPMAKDAPKVAIRRCASPQTPDRLAQRPARANGASRSSGSSPIRDRLLKCPRTIPHATYADRVSFPEP